MLEKIRSEISNIENTATLTQDAPQPASTATATEPKTSDMNAFPVQMQTCHQNPALTCGNTGKLHVSDMWEQSPYMWEKKIMILPLS